MFQSKLQADFSACDIMWSSDAPPDDEVTLLDCNAEHWSRVREGRSRALIDKVWCRSNMSTSADLEGQLSRWWMLVWYSFTALSASPICSWQSPCQHVSDISKWSNQSRCGMPGKPSPQKSSSRMLFCSPALCSMQ